MRTLLVLGLGILSGVMATVLTFTLPGNGGSDPPPTAGTGDARLSLEPLALAAVVEQEMATAWNGDGPSPLVEVDIQPGGQLIVRFGVSPSRNTPTGTVVLDPQIREGTLLVIVVEADLMGTSGDAVARALEGGLRRRMDSLAGTDDYRLVAISTASSRLTLEIEL